MECTCESIHCKLSASLGCHNLSWSGASQTLCYSHLSKVTLVKTKSATPKQRIIEWKTAPGFTPPLITQAKFVSLIDREVLCLGSLNGVQIYTQDGSVMLFNWSFQNETNESTFIRGICSNGKNLIFTGTHNGEILVFESDRGANGSFTLISRPRKYANAITDVDSTADHVISADCVGLLALYTIKGNDLVHLQTMGTDLDDGDTPCTGVRLWYRFVIACYSNGIIRGFSLSTGHRILEVYAHVRYISGLNVTKEGYLMTTSEDSFVRIWKLRENTASPCLSIEHLYYNQLEECQLVGGVFINDATFAITAFADSSIYTFRKIPA